MIGLFILGLGGLFLLGWIGFTLAKITGALDDIQSVMSEAISILSR